MDLLRGGVRDGVAEVVELVEWLLDGVLVQVEAAQRVHDPDGATRRRTRQKNNNKRLTSDTLHYDFVHEDLIVNYNCD